MQLPIENFSPMTDTQLHALRGGCLAKPAHKTNRRLQSKYIRTHHEHRKHIKCQHKRANWHGCSRTRNDFASRSSSGGSNNEDGRPAPLHGAKKAEKDWLRSDVVWGKFGDVGQKWDQKRKSETAPKIAPKESHRQNCNILCPKHSPNLLPSRQQRFLLRKKEMFVKKTAH